MECLSSRESLGGTGRDKDDSLRLPMPSSDPPSPTPIIVNVKDITDFIIDLADRDKSLQNKQLAGCCCGEYHLQYANKKRSCQHFAYSDTIICNFRETRKSVRKKIEDRWFCDGADGDHVRYLSESEAVVAGECPQCKSKRESTKRELKSAEHERKLAERERKLARRKLLMRKLKSHRRTSLGLGLSQEEIVKREREQVELFREAKERHQVRVKEELDSEVDMKDIIDNDKDSDGNEDVDDNFKVEDDENAKGKNDIS